MNTVLINDEPARTAQQIADALARAPESVRVKVDGDETLRPIVPGLQVSFAAEDGTLGMIHVNAEGKATVEVCQGAPAWAN